MSEVLPVGVAEIGERLGVRQQTVAQWKLRGVLPPPRWTVSRHPAWNWPDIEEWATQRRSLKQPPSYAFSFYVTLDEGISQANARRLLEAAGAEEPIHLGTRPMLVKFRRHADNYTEATVCVINQLAGSGISLSGGPIAQGTMA